MTAKQQEPAQAAIFSESKPKEAKGLKSLDASKKIVAGLETLRMSFLKKLEAEERKIAEARAAISKHKEKLDSIEVQIFREREARRLQAMELMLQKHPELQEMLDAELAVIDATAPAKAKRGRPAKAK